MQLKILSYLIVLILSINYIEAACHGREVAVFNKTQETVSVVPDVMFETIGITSDTLRQQTTSLPTITIEKNSNGSFCITNGKMLVRVTVNGQKIIFGMTHTMTREQYDALRNVTVLEIGKGAKGYKIDLK
jgi:hypothetical protein